MAGLELRDTPEGVVLRLRVTPRGGRNELRGVHDGALKLAVSAPAERGKANAAVLKLLARELGVPRSAVRLTAGAASHSKTVVIQGLDAEGVRRRLEAQAPGG